MSSALRDLVYERDSYTCIFCHSAASETHHVTHRSQGGRNVPWNLISVCRIHHLILHGERIKGEERDRDELAQTALEYVSDYYAEDFYGR